MVAILVFLFIGSVIFAAACCYLIRGGAIHEREMRELEERKKRVAEWVASKQLQ